MAIANTEDIIIYMSFFFVDIVGLSDPSTSTSTQINKIKTLNRLISKCPTFTNSTRDEIAMLPTGDGMVIGFRNGIEKPMLLAIELHLKLREHNYVKGEHEKVRVRIGCNDGHVFTVNDIYGNLNLWGPGIILARRVMDLGDADHILMTSSMAENVMELSNEYQQMIHPVHDFEIKHGQKILLYSVYGQDFGNTAKPVKGLHSLDRKTVNMTKEDNETLSYKKIELKYVLTEPVSGQITYKRTCYIRNNTTTEPIFVFKETIADVEKSLSDINLRLFDEQKNELKVSSVISDNLTKEFIVKFNEPLLPNENNRLYSLAYETQRKEKFLTESFKISCQGLNVTFEYPADFLTEPRLIYIRNGDEDILDRDVTVRSSGRYIVRWKKHDGIVHGDKIRLEW